MMFKKFCENLPSRRFLLVNILFWLGFNTIAALSSYERKLNAGIEADLLYLWTMLLSFWGQWIWLTPIIITCVSMLPYRRGKWIKLIVINFLLMAVLISINWGFSMLVASWLHYGNFAASSLEHAARFLFVESPYYLDCVIYLAIVCVGYMRIFDKRVLNEEIRNKELAHQLTQVEYDALKSQLNPHFLFNTLNSIAGLIRHENKASALKAVSELSIMLRKVLEHQNSQMIPLSQELEFIESYLTIQKMRFSDRLDMQMSVEPECLELDFPFMLLQPLIENAVQHGVRSNIERTVLQLDIKMSNDELHLTLVNKVPKVAHKKGFGIGLENCRRRLELMYSKHFTLESKPIKDDYFETYLCIPVGEDD